MKKLITTLILVSLLSFKTADNRSVYNVPLGASGVCVADQDLDGNMDIFTEHIIDSETNWGGTYILQNDGFGQFSFMDSIYYSTGMHDVYADTVFNNIYPEIVSGNAEYVNFLSYDGENYTQNRFFMGTNINAFDIGDVDNNGHIDVVFISNQERYWGVIYNQGDGSFTVPEYYDLDYPPIDIACSDLNDDSRDDMVITGSSCEIYFSTETGFEMQPLQYNSAYVRIEDFNNDDNTDIITFSTAGSGTIVYLYKNIGNNMFDSINSFYIMQGTSKFFISDFNNDDLPDVLFATYPHQGGYIVYYNQGNFQFGETQYIDLTYYGEGWRSTYCADMDGNSFVDIVVARRSFGTTIPSSVEILFNDGQGNFVDDPLTTTYEPDENTIANFINYPNPFKNNTTFEFTINKTSHIEISVYNLQGKLVKNLMNKNLEGGKHSIKWGGLNNASQACKPSFYIIILKVNGILQETIKILKY